MNELGYLIILPSGSNFRAVSEDEIKVSAFLVVGAITWTFITLSRSKMAEPIKCLTCKHFAGPVIGSVILN